MRRISSIELRSSYLEFFVGKGHVVIPSASLVPANDPTVLFTTAGMHPLVPHLLGEPHPAGTRLVNVQKCVRTGDIDVIGDDTHLTCFEMLGNWSLGDYGRDEAIGWSCEFLTAVLGLPMQRLAATCFAGDDIPRDVASAQRWQQLGMPPERIAFLGRDNNWWGPAGATGPCGPDTEIFYWVDASEPPRQFDPADARWVEIWNNVFMSYAKTADGRIEPLARGNVDTGMGLERTLVALNGARSVYAIDTVAPLFHELQQLRPDGGDGELRVITDHLRAACMMIADGVGPSNKDRGYIVRRVLRRAFVLARRLELPDHWHELGIARVVEMLGGQYPELASQRHAIVTAIADERVRFERAIAAGLRALRSVTTLDGKVAFDLFQNHGIPFELTVELAHSTGRSIDRAEFQRAFEHHRSLSRTTSSGAFAGGLADHSTEIVRYHTLTHLLHAALREVLGTHVIQRGSNITKDRLRFDFSHDRKLAPEELARVEAIVADWLARDLRVERSTMTEPEARALGAIGAFGEKYGETVSVYTIRDASDVVVSREFCGGPHVQAGSELRGAFHIVREQAVSAGIRRIKAVLITPAPAA